MKTHYHGMVLLKEARRHKPLTSPLSGLGWRFRMSRYTKQTGSGDDKIVTMAKLTSLLESYLFILKVQVMWWL